MSRKSEFRIDWPYGIEKQESGKWIAFNREYMPLGYREGELGPSINYLNSHESPNYENIPEGTLVDLAGQHTIRKDSNGIITQIFLYNDGTNPTNTRSTKEQDRLYDIYEAKFKELLKYEIDHIG